jgi:hypothetical protein
LDFPDSTAATTYLEDLASGARSCLATTPSGTLARIRTDPLSRPARCRSQKQWPTIGDETVRLRVDSTDVGATGDEVLIRYGYRIMAVFDAFVTSLPVPSDRELSILEGVACVAGSIASLARTGG